VAEAGFGFAVTVRSGRLPGFPAITVPDFMVTARAGALAGFVASALRVLAAGWRRCFGPGSPRGVGALSRVRRGDFFAVSLVVCRSMPNNSPNRCRQVVGLSVAGESDQVFGRDRVTNSR
jgi:hypothetical protein